ncbi:DUF4012 domain-containing protein [Arthrobacter cavernae]|uniref:DUF4012 domain-containing protein n=1 Tax=Arthrobacter cavernae TaxID=2817681 RepID=A0A939HI34_9MICC|nr:DUF4012 domain-containing protein [Arthrobacter cavernae]MBO1267713.1 DUF4012 domain-containing protein [Arthrobacter cavernae]
MPATPDAGVRTEVRRRRTVQRRKILQRRSRVIRVALSSAAVAAVLGAATAWIGYQGLQLKDGLESASALLPQLKEQVLANDTAGASQTLAALQGHTAKARQAAGDPLWSAASLLPGLGPNLAAGAEVAKAADDIARLAAAPMIRAFGSLDWEAMTPVDGQISLEPIRNTSPSIIAAAKTVQLAHDRLESIDAGGLLPPVRDPLVDTRAKLNDVRLSLNSAAGAVQLLPAMMGGEGPRNYLVLIQNNAEVRASGGIPGALAVIRADHGKIRMEAQAAASELGAFTPAVPVDPAQTAIFTDRLGTYMQDVNTTPDFPTAAATAKTMWETRHPGQVIDGVLAVDTMAMARLLLATGPVEIPAGTVSATSSGALATRLAHDNLMKTLLSDAYAQLPDPEEQDDYFDAVARNVFNAVAGGQGSAEELIKSVSASAADGRLLMWSGRSQEQGIIQQLPIGGAISGPSVPGAAFGVYFNDGTGAKMDYYVKRSVQLIQTCTPDGASGYTAKVTLTNSAPLDAGTSLPKYVTGDGNWGVKPGNVRTVVAVYGPAESELSEASLNGQPAPVGSFRQLERPVGTMTVQLAPGESATTEVSFDQVSRFEAPQLTVTPTIQDRAEVVQAMRSRPCA